MDYVVKLTISRLDERYILEAEPVPNNLHTINGAHGDFGSILCSVIGYHRIAKGKIKLKCKDLSPIQVDSLESVVKMHNQLKDIKQPLR